MWITNGGFSDIYIVFAKVDGEKFSSFIVERGTPGFSVGAEENKMGIRGSSTVPLFFENAAIPKENLLHEIGRGHIVAFNTLNAGRFSLGASCAGRSQERPGDRLEIREGAHRVRKVDCRVRLDQGQARRNGDPHLRARVDDLPLGGDDRGGGRQRRHRQGEAGHAGPRGIRDRKLDQQGGRQRNARLLRGRSRADFRRLRLPRGLSRGAHLPRQPHQPHLRGHQRNQPHAHHPDAHEARDVGRPAADSRRHEIGRRASLRAFVRGSAKRARSPRKKDRSRRPRKYFFWRRERRYRNSAKSWPTSRKSWARCPTS